MRNDAKPLTPEARVRFAEAESTCASRPTKYIQQVRVGHKQKAAKMESTM